MFPSCTINLTHCFTKWEQLINKLKLIKYGSNQQNAMDSIDLLNLLKNESLSEGNIYIGICRYFNIFILNF